MDYNICSESNCMNRCAPGYTMCNGHLWGFPQRASDEAIEWKMKQLKKSIENKVRQE